MTNDLQAINERLAQISAITDKRKRLRASDKLFYYIHNHEEDLNKISRKLGCTDIICMMNPEEATNSSKGKAKDWNVECKIAGISRTDSV